MIRISTTLTWISIILRLDCSLWLQSSRGHPRSHIHIDYNWLHDDAREASTSQSKLTPRVPLLLVCLVSVYLLGWSSFLESWHINYVWCLGYWRRWLLVLWFNNFWQIVVPLRSWVWKTYNASAEGHVGIWKIAYYEEKELAVFTLLFYW